MMQLQQFCYDQGIEADIIETSDPVESAGEAAKFADAGIEQVIKSLVFYVDSQPFLVVVRGPDYVDENRLKDLLAAEDCRMADRDEVEAETGYEAGAVPPVSTDLQKIVDERVLEYDEVLGGGGSSHRLIALDPRFIVDERDFVGDIIDER